MSSNPNPEAQFNRVLIHLQHEDPEMRKRAVNWLAKSGRKEALRPLEWTAASDPDPAIRKYAQKAVKYIQGQDQTLPPLAKDYAKNTMQTPVVRVKDDDASSDDDQPKSLHDLRRSGKTGTLGKGKKGQASGGKTGRLSSGKTGTLSKRQTLLSKAVKATAEPDPDPPRADEESSPDRATGAYFNSVDEELAAVIEGYEVYPYQDPNAEDYVSRADYEQARTLIQQAYNDYVHQEPFSEVIKKIGRAIDLDHHVREEEATQKTLAAVMDMPASRALEIVEDRTQRDIYIGRRRRQERYGIRVYTTWVDVLWRFGVFFLVHAAGLAGVLVLLLMRGNDLLAALANNREYGAQVRIQGVDPAAGFAALNTTLAAYGINGLAQYGLMVAVALTLLLVVGHFVAHGLAYFLGGKGTVTETQTNLIVTPMWVSGVTYIVAIIAILGLYPTGYRSVEGAGQALLNVSRYFLVLPLLVIGFQQINRMGYTHELDIGKSVVIFVFNSLILIGGAALLYFFVPGLTL